MSSRTMIAPGPPLCSIGVTHHPTELSARSIPALVGQVHRLARGRIADEGQHVARQLHSRSRAGLTRVNDQRREQFEHGLDALVDIVVGADHDGELTLLGRARATADRRVDDVDALGLKLPGEFLGGGLG